MNENVPDILLVEDNMFDAELTIRTLRQKNIAKNIVHVATGALALDFLNATGEYKDRDIKDKPRVILLDLKLGPISGVSILKKIKGDEQTRNIPVIVLSGSKEDVDLKKCYALGVNSFLIKPIEFGSFTESVLIPLLSRKE